MTVSYAAFAPPSFTNDQILGIFFFEKSFCHQFHGSSDPVEAPQAAALYHVDEISAAGKPGGFLSDSKNFTFCPARKDTHLGLDRGTQFQVRMMKFQPVEGRLFFRTYAVEVDGCYMETVFQKKFCET